MSGSTSKCKFQVGDRVIVTNPLGYDIRREEGRHGDYFLGDTGVIVEFEDIERVRVCFDNPSIEFNFPRDEYFVNIEEIELDEIVETPLWKALS